MNEEEKKSFEPYPCKGFNYFQFNTLTFSSQFDSGNLLNAKQISKYSYDIYIASDCYGSSYQKNSCTWFHFKTSCFQHGVEYNFTICNMNNQMKLLSEGLSPVCRSLPKNNFYTRISTPCYNIKLIDGALTFTFSYTFHIDETEVYFAFTYPFSYKDYQNMMVDIEKQAKILNKKLFFSRECLIKTLDGQDVDLLTLTSVSGMVPSEKEPQITKEVTINKYTKKSFTVPVSESRPPKFLNKKYVFISARVHPGEVPSSHILNGILAFLFSDCDQSNKILDHFVFVLVPILNPDGVTRGHFRHDSAGQNLNRHYLAPLPTLQPSIFAVKILLSNLASQNKLYFYLDLHAHANKKGSFIYGNNLQYLDHIDMCMFPKLLDLNCSIFNYEDCNFSEKNMYSKDKGDSLSKEGSGRVAVFKATKVIRCYTLECNYNKIDFEKESIEQVGEIDTAQSDLLFMSAYKTPKKTFLGFFGLQEFWKIGKSICISLLDLIGQNSKSRLGGTPYKNLANLKFFMGHSIIKDIPFRFDPVYRKILKQVSKNPELMHKVLNKECIDENEGIDTKKPPTKMDQLKLRKGFKPLTAKVYSLPKKLN